MLRNRLNLRQQAELDQAEAILVELRLSEPLPGGSFDAKHYRAIHRHLFQDLYPWAGRYRTVRLSKGGSHFCYPEHIPAQMELALGQLQGANRLCGLSGPEFVQGCAEFMATINHIHPFREGNGRTMMAFVALLATTAGHRLDILRIERDAYMAAMVAAFGGDNAPLIRQIGTWLID